MANTTFKADNGITARDNSEFYGPVTIHSNTEIKESLVVRNGLTVEGPVTGISGFTGSRGFTGSKGDIGSQGFTGSSGFTGSASTALGPIGYTGSLGPTGFTGSASTALGPIGYTGSRGADGYQGTDGYTGSRGYVGSIGGLGYTGSRGYTGSASTVAGFTGSQGSQGPIGYTGSQGSQGNIGYTGSQGGSGFTGSRGNVGYTGSGVSGSPQFTALGVGRAAGSTGTIYATSNIYAYASSDKRLKKNVRKIHSALEKVSQLNGVHFDWTDEFLHSQGGEDGYLLRKADVGVIAQEVQSVFPDVVTERPDGTLAVKYDRLIPLLIEAIKELKDKIDDIA